MVLTNEEKIKEYTEKGWWVTETIYDLFKEHVKKRPHVETVVDPLNREEICYGAPRKMTFAQLEEEAEKVAAILFKNGVRKDDIVIVQLPNVVEMIVTYLAILRIGAIASPFPVQYREHEYEELIHFVEAKAVITMDRIDKFHNAQSFVNIKEKLPSLSHIFVWGEHIPQGTISLNDQIISADDRKKLLDYEKTIEITANDIFTICWTSGTEGKPKGVPRTHNQWYISAYATVDIVRLTEKDRLLNTFPIVNMAGIGGVFIPWLQSGCKLILHHPFDFPVFLKQIALEKVTYTLMPPALLNLLLHKEDILKNADISSVRVVGSGSAPLSPWMVKGWKEKYNIDIINFFGSNEGITLLSGPEDIPDPEIRAQFFPRFGIKGFQWSTRIADRIETKLVDMVTGEEIKETNHPGELYIKGAGVFDGYYNRPDLNEKSFDGEGYFKTGDLFEIVGEGDTPKYYRYVGRAKDIIIRGGMNISPEELEYVLQNHPKVAEVAVVGYPDEIMGEKACACVVLKDKNDPITLEEIVQFFNTKKIAKYKIPERLLILDSLPRNPVGKILKSTLREYVK